MESILLVEDKPELREMLQHALARMGHEAVPAASLSEARTLLSAARFSAVLTDLKLPDGSGMDVLRTALDLDAAIPVIIMTAYGSIAQAVEAMRQGAYDFIQKPLDLGHLEHMLSRALERQQILRENLVLKEEFAKRHGFPRIIGEHPAMLQAGREMQRVAMTESTVLLLGESGTGKELFARATHQLSPRAGRPFIAINCAAIPETLIENELFGHDRGAFTGAAGRQAGKFELAHRGTIFLDEIGELPAAAQSKLLRVLEDHKVERLGGTAPVPCDVRVIAATNRELEKAAESGAFRRDLYYRLAVVPITIPPLRERGDDVLLIAGHFLERFRREFKKNNLRFSSGASAALQQHTWPGNVRELQNAIERAAILNDGEITASELGLPGRPPSRDDENSKTQERQKIESMLRECKWNKTAAAERLGISYKTLLTKIKVHGLD
ncbi:MAG TPA: sigma-54 dependent transcriptional regulator [Candidatus Angelobacter sp.]|nr:sigma-54 dependent transcriptional regulator [Candidatus Angelobacter sp.]